MRMSIRVTLGVLVAALLGVFLLVGIVAGPAGATTAVPQAAPIVSARLAGVAPAAAPLKAATTTAAGTTTDFNKGQQEADAAVAHRKLIMGIACVVLLLIVWIGHRAKGKHILRVKNLQNAKS
jgi:hypothetical protein